MIRQTTDTLPLPQLETDFHAVPPMKPFPRGMQVDPELLSLNNQDDDRAAVAPDLLELSHNMEKAQTRMTSREPTEDFQEDGPSSIPPDQTRDPDPVAVLREFIRTHSDFAERYQQAESVVSAVFAALEEDAVFFKSTFDRKSASRSKSRILSQSLLSQSLSAMVSLVPTLPMEGEHDALFESLISPHTSQYVSLVDVMASKNYSKRARTRRAIAKPSETEMMANAVVFSASHIVTDEPAILDLAGETLSISREHDVATANQLEALKAAMLDYQGPQSPAGSSSSSRENRDDRRGPGRPKGSLNKTHVPAWQTRERRRLRQKERREQARLDRAVEIERRRIEDPTFVSPKRKVGRPRKVRDPVGELVNPSTGLEEEVGLGILDQHQGVSMGLSDMSEGMGLDMTVMGLDYQSDSASFAHIHSGDHHHDHLSHSHQLPHDMLAGHGHHSELQHHHHHDPDLQDSSMHQDGGVMQMLDMPNALNDMTVGVDDETSYLTYGSETYAYTLDAIERAHAAVRAEEERNGM